MCWKPDSIRLASLICRRNSVGGEFVQQSEIQLRAKLVPRVGRCARVLAGQDSAGLSMLIYGEATDRFASRAQSDMSVWGFESSLNGAEFEAPQGVQTARSLRVLNLSRWISCNIYPHSPLSSRVLTASREIYQKVFPTKNLSPHGFLFRS